jgi:hypothetical protein
MKLSKFARSVSTAPAVLTGVVKHCSSTAAYELLRGAK